MIINVNDMHCGKCVERIAKAMEQEGIDAVVTLEDKTVAIQDEQVQGEQVLELLDDLGFCECNIQ